MPLTRAGSRRYIPLDLAGGRHAYTSVARVSMFPACPTSDSSGPTAFTWGEGCGALCTRWASTLIKRTVPKTQPRTTYGENYLASHFNGISRRQNVRDSVARYPAGHGVSITRTSYGASAQP